MMTFMICPRCRAAHLRVLENRVTHDQYVLCDDYPYCAYVDNLDPWIPVDLITEDSSGSPAA